MTKIQILISPIIFILFIFMGYFGFNCYIHTKTYENSLKEIAIKSDIGSKARQKIDDIKSTISFGLLTNKTKKEFLALQKNKNKNKNLAKSDFYHFLEALFLVLILSFLMPLRLEALGLGISTLMSLAFGLITPVLMVTIHKEVEYLGDIVLSFESKGIIDSILKLFHSGENTVAIVILLFSVIIPLIKSLTLLFVLIFPFIKISHKVLIFFKYIGKWSMVDVFVVSIFLVFLAGNDSQITHAKIEFGLYFFLIYVLLSTITTIRVQKILSKINI